MTLKNAVFLDLASVHRGDLDITGLERVIPHWDWRANTQPEEVATVIAEADVVVLNKVFITENQFAQASKLKLICVTATGVNNIDLVAAKSRNIVVSNVRNYATASVVQHVFAMLLSLNTHLQEYTRLVQKGGWSRSEYFCSLDYPIRELEGMTIGIIGYGVLGEAVAKVARTFGMRVIIAQRDDMDNRDGRIPLQELLKQADVVSLHCPLNEQTRGMIGPKELALMKTDAIVINTARGDLVDEVALLDALQNKKLGGAGIDVIAQEPPASDYPLLQVQLPNLIVTPHIAWASTKARQNVLNEIVENISSFINGVPRNQM